MSCVFAFERFLIYVVFVISRNLEIRHYYTKAVGKPTMFFVLLKKNQQHPNIDQNQSFLCSFWINYNIFSVQLFSKRACLFKCVLKPDKGSADVLKLIMMLFSLVC